MRSLGQRIVDDLDHKDVEISALRLLTAREHSRAELRRKLSARCSDPDTIEKVLDGLEAQNALSDRRFVEEYVASRRRRGYGPRRIRMELRDKGVAPDLVSDWLNENDPEWDEVLREAARRKYGERPAGDFRERAKRCRFLEYRGFSPDRIRAFMDEGG